MIQQKSDEVELSDHIQFLITEVSAPAAPSIQEKEPPDDVDVLTEGNFLFFSFLNSLSICDDDSKFEEKVEYGI